MTAIPSKTEGFILQTLFFLRTEDWAKLEINLNRNLFVKRKLGYDLETLQRTITVSQGAS